MNIEDPSIKQNPMFFFLFRHAKSSLGGVRCCHVDIWCVHVANLMQLLEAVKSDVRVELAGKF